MGERGPEPDYDEDDVYEIFEDQQDPCEPRTATEVAEALDCSRSTAYNLLQELAEKGVLESKKVGARGRVWWMSDSQHSDGK